MTAAPGRVVGPLRIGVVGIGHLGRHHARIARTQPGVTLAAVADLVPERAATAAADSGALVTSDYRELLTAVDAVIVAVPTAAHAVVASACLERGIHVLVEKPMTSSLAEADHLIEMAARHRAILAVGHSERFNPAVAAALPLVHAPRFIEVHRLSTFPERSLDVDVIFDVMIHDLDIILSVDRSELLDVQAVGIAVLTPRVDIANVRLTFASGCIANLTASRISRDQVRKIRFFQRDSYVSIDCASKEVEAWRLVPQPGGRPSIEGGPVAVQNEEPLARELADFVAAIREGRPPLVPGGDGRRALALATRVTDVIAKTAATDPGQDHREAVKQ